MDKKIIELEDYRKKIFNKEYIEELDIYVDTENIRNSLRKELRKKVLGNE